MRTDPNTSAVDTLRRALNIYQKMQNRRWDTTLFGLQTARNEPEHLPSLQELLSQSPPPSDQVVYERLRQTISESVQHEKFSLALKVAQMHFAINGGDMLIDIALPEFKRMSDHITRGLQEEISKSAPSVESSSLTEKVSETMISLVSSVRQWTASFFNDFEFSLAMSHLLTDVMTDVSKKFQENNAQSESLQSKVQEEFTQLCTKLNAQNREMDMLHKQKEQHEQEKQVLKEERNRLTELLKLKETEEAKKDQNGILYEYSPAETQYITGKIVKRLEELVMADHVFESAFRRAQDRQDLKPGEKDWVGRMYQRFKGVYHVIFNGRSADQIKEKFEKDFPNEFLEAQDLKALSYVIGIYQKSDFLRTANTAHAKTDREKEFIDKAGSQSEASKAMAAFGEELHKRIANLQEGCISDLARLAGFFAQRNHQKIKAHVKQELPPQKGEEEEQNNAHVFN